MLLMSSHVAFPREGHLDAAVHVMAHVGQRYNSKLVYDSSYPEIGHNALRNVIGQSSIIIPRKLYLQMCQNLDVRRLTSACL